MKSVFKLLAMMVLAITGFIFNSCGSDDEEDYSYIIETTDFGSKDPIILDITVFEYNSKSEKVNSQSWEDVQYYSSKTYTANPQTEKIKIYYKMYHSSISSVSQRGWIQQVFYLNSGKITLTGKTMLGSVEP